MRYGSYKNQKGQLSLQVLIFATVAVVMMSGFIFLALSFLKLSVRSLNKASAFSIAEAGIEYYRWHLAHASTDYQDGTGGPGPYVHNYYGKNGELIGTFTLDITPPPNGVDVVTIKSTGKVIADDSIEKIIKVKLGINSLTKYAMVGNQYLNITSSTSVYGLVHANGGINFEGKGYNLVTSAQTTYDDTEHSGSNEWAVHTHISPVDPLPPTPLPARPDIFAAGREVGIPPIDFVKITSDLATIKSNAQSGGLYFASSTAIGYHLVLKTNGKFDLYKVTQMLNKFPGCNNSQQQDNWDTWSIDGETLLGEYNYPANGLIFLEDNTWVDGQINGNRLTIAVGSFPQNSATDKSIIINKDILYTNYDGSDALGLIGQRDISFGILSEDDLRIDGAMVAQSGRIGRYDYRPGTSQGNGCQPYHIRTLITTYGMLATNQNWLFNYSDYSGYQTKNLNYDIHLLFNPPPFFPRSGDAYIQLSWEEVK